MDSFTIFSGLSAIAKSFIHTFSVVSSFVLSESRHAIRILKASDFPFIRFRVVRLFWPKCFSRVFMVWEMFFVMGLNM